MTEAAIIEAPAAPSPAPAPAAAPIIGGGTPPPAAGDLPEWRAGLPPELRDAPGLAKFKDVAALAKGHIEAESLIGRKGLVVPKADDPPAVHAAYRQALGIPEKPDGYEIKVEGAPETVWNPDTGKVLANWAHELGLTPAQAQGLAERYAKLGGDGIGAERVEHERRNEEGAAALRNEWGAAYAAKVDYANRAVTEFGGEALLTALRASGLASDPAVVKAFAAIGERIGEDRPAGIGTGRSAGVMTPADAAAELKRIMAQDQPIWNRKHPEYDAAIRRRDALIEMGAVI